MADNSRGKEQSNEEDDSANSNGAEKSAHGLSFPCQCNRTKM
jgi:hypothetical protein